MGVPLDDKRVAVGMFNIIRRGIAGVASYKKEFQKSFLTLYQAAWAVAQEDKNKFNTKPLTQFLGKVERNVNFGQIKNFLKGSSSSYKDSEAVERLGEAIGVVLAVALFSRMNWRNSSYFCNSGDFQVARLRTIALAEGVKKVLDAFGVSDEPFKLRIQVHAKKAPSNVFLESLFAVFE